MRIFPVLIIFALAGCENKLFDDGIKKAVRAQLKDPDSAKFESSVIFKNRGCVEVNAKNSYGAYSGRTSANLHRYDSSGQWYVDTLDGKSCTESEMKDLQDKDDKVEAMEYEVLGLAKQKKIIDESVTSRTQLNGECRKLLDDTATAFRIGIAESGKDSEKWMARYKEGMAKIAAGTCGSPAP